VLDVSYERDKEKQNIEEYSYLDGKVTGLLGKYKNELTIYSWQSYDDGNGNTVEALKLLRKKFTKIIVSEIGGSPQDSSWRYWIHMREKGLVDILEESYDKLVP
jgi:hypothetical protein